MSVLRWSASLSRKVYIVARLYSISVVLFNLTSQFFLLVSLLLPLKVIFILGAGGIPGYFPEVLQSLDHHSLVIGLSVGALLAFVLYLILEAIIAVLIRRAAVRVAARSDKLPFIANQQQTTVNYLGKVLAIQSDAVFTLLVLIFITFLYPDVIGVLGFYSLLVTCVLFLSWRTCLAQCVRGNISFSTKLIATFLFFLVFGYVVYEGLTGHLNSLLAAVLVLILFRQLLTRVTRLVANIDTLYRRKDKVDALFFHGKQLAQYTVSAEGGLGVTFSVGSVKRIIVEALMLPSDQVEVVDVQYHYLVGVKGVDCCFVRVIVKNQAEKEFFLKKYHFDRSVQADKELSVVQGVSGLPLLPFVGSLTCEGCRYLLYAVPGECKAERVHKCDTSKLLLKIAVAKPSRQLVNRYFRTHSAFYKNFNPEVMLQLAEFGSDEHKDKNFYVQLCGRIDELKSCLMRLPLCVINHDLMRSGCAVSFEGQDYVLHWGAWDLVPLGAAMPVTMTKNSEAPTALVELRELAGKDLTANELRLSALAYRFYRELRKKNIESLRWLSKHLLSVLDELKLEEAK